jgi:hypothetical protein
MAFRGDGKGFGAAPTGAGAKSFPIVIATTSRPSAFSAESLSKLDEAGRAQILAHLADLKLDFKNNLLDFGVYVHDLAEDETTRFTIKWEGAKSSTMLFFVRYQDGSIRRWSAYKTSRIEVLWWKQIAEQDLALIKAGKPASFSAEDYALALARLSRSKCMRGLATIPYDGQSFLRLVLG